MTHYCEALTVNTNHQFWQRGAGEMMLFTPHPITAKLIINADAHFRSHNNSFLLKDDDSPQQAPLLETLPNADFRLTSLKHAVEEQAFVPETIVYS